MKEIILLVIMVSVMFVLIIRHPSPQKKILNLCGIVENKYSPIEHVGFGSENAFYIVINKKQYQTYYPIIYYNSNIGEKICVENYRSNLIR